MLLYLPLLVIAVGYLVYWYFTRTFNYWKDRNVVTPPLVPLFGNIKESALRKKFIGCLLRDIYEQFPNERFVGFYTMTSPNILIRDLDLIKLIMIKDFNKFSDRGIGFGKKGLGANLFHADTETWRVLRSRFSPIFTSGKLKNMYHLVVERADRVFAEFEKEVAVSTEQNITSLSVSYTMSTIIACAFGLDLGVHDSKLKVLAAIDKMVLTPSFAVELILMYPGLLKKLNASVFPAKVVNFFYDLVKTVFEQRNNKSTGRGDFMDIILEMRAEKVIQSGKLGNDSELEITDEIIAAQAFIFYVGGYETSATTASFLLYELAKNIDVQEKLIAEIDAVFKKHEGSIPYDTLMELPYLSQVFDETLRKYPIVEPILRCAQEDYKIPDSDVTIKKGQLVYLSAQGVHYDETLYPNPEQFVPERFSPENSRDRHPCAFLPFGVGPRNCIGLRFGKMQTRLFIAKFFSKYRVEPSINTPEKMPIEPNRLLLGPLKGLVPLNVIPRAK